MPLTDKTYTATPWKKEKTLKKERIQYENQPSDDNPYA